MIYRHPRLLFSERIRYQYWDRKYPFLSIWQRWFNRPWKPTSSYWIPFRWRPFRRSW